jgi:hypothetical protein
VDVEVDPVDGDEIVEALHQSAGMYKRQLGRCVHALQPTDRAAR